MFQFPSGPEAKVTLCPPDLVEIYAEPYVSGTRAVEYYGPVSSVGFASYAEQVASLDNVALAFLPDLQRATSVLGGNVVLGCDLAMDPFALKDGELGLGWSALGTAARLEPLWG